MTASTPTTVSPSSVRIARNTPWADGCCGPMFMVRRSLPPYPISSVLRAVSGMRLFHRGDGRRNQHRGLHADEQRQRLAEKRLPLGIAEGVGARGGPLVQILVHPEVDGLVELAGLGLPVADVARVLLAAGQHPLGQVEPLREPADLRAIPAQLVDIAAVRRWLERRGRRQHLVFLGQQQRADLRNVALRPLVVLRELAAQSVALVEARIAPQVDVLVQHAELGRPATFELPILVAADLAADLGVELEVLGLLAGLKRIGAQLVDHDAAPLVSGTVRAACRRRSPCAADAPPSLPPTESGDDRDAPRSERRTCPSTRAPSSRHHATPRSAWGNGPSPRPIACAT